MEEEMASFRTPLYLTLTLLLLHSEHPVRTFRWALRMPMTPLLSLVHDLGVDSMILALHLVVVSLMLVLGVNRLAEFDVGSLKWLNRVANKRQRWSSGISSEVVQHALKA